MKKSVFVRKCVPFFLCCLLVLSVFGCSSGTPSSTEGIPLLLRYTDTTQHEDRLIKMTWNPEKGTADIDMNAALSFKNMATKLDFWVPLGLQYGVAAEGALPSNTAIYWNGADKITLFTSEEYSSQKLQGNSLSADIVTVSATPLCKQYFNAANCYTTSTTLYSFKEGSPISTIYEITSAEAETTTLQGYIIGIGKSDEKTYALTSTTGEGIPGSNEYLLLYTIDPTGSISQQTVQNSKFENFSYRSDNGVWATFANGNFYTTGAKINATSGTPEYTQVQSLIDGFQVISSATALEPFGYAAPSPAFYAYKNYLLTVGQTFSFDELTVAAFKNEKLVGFILITPLDKPEANLVTYDATGKQLNTYRIQTPVQIVVPQS